MYGRSNKSQIQMYESTKFLTKLYTLGTSFNCHDNSNLSSVLKEKITKVFSKLTMWESLTDLHFECLSTKFIAIFTLLNYQRKKYHNSVTYLQHLTKDGS